MINELIERLQIEPSKVSISKFKELLQRCQAKASLNHFVGGNEVPAYCLDIAMNLNQETFCTSDAVKYLGTDTATYNHHRKTVAECLDIKLRGHTFNSLASQFGSSQIIPDCKSVAREYRAIQQGSSHQIDYESESFQVSVFLAVSDCYVSLRNEGKILNKQHKKELTSKMIAKILLKIKEKCSVLLQEITGKAKEIKEGRTPSKGAKSKNISATRIAQLQNRAPVATAKSPSLTAKQMILIQEDYIPPTTDENRSVVSVDLSPIRNDKNSGTKDQFELQSTTPSSATRRLTTKVLDDEQTTPSSTSRRLTTKVLDDNQTTPSRSSKRLITKLLDDEPSPKQSTPIKVSRTPQSEKHVQLNETISDQSEEESDELDTDEIERASKRKTKDELKSRLAKKYRRRVRFVNGYNFIVYILNKIPQDSFGYKSI